MLGTEGCIDGHFESVPIENRSEFLLVYYYCLTFASSKGNRYAGTLSSAESTQGATRVGTGLQARLDQQFASREQTKRMNG